MKKITCPLCFEQIAVPEIGWRCERPECQEATFFREEQDIPFMERAGLAPSPRRWIHTVRSAKGIEKCGRVATIRVCPKCYRELPTDIEQLSNLSIAVIGAKGSGKSHYVAMLIHRLWELAPEFDWSLMPLTGKTVDRYENEFWNPLMKEGKTLLSTQEDVETNPPLVYSLQVGVHTRHKRRVMLTFFDTAGENFQNGEGVARIKRYIYKASGLICLLDPLQLDKIRNALSAKGHGEEELPVKESDTGNIIQRMYLVIDSGRDLRGKDIDIPLALAFSKMDFVPDAGDTAKALCESLRRGTRHRGVFHEEEFQNIDAQMRAWIKEVDDRRSILQSVTRFRMTGFFGFSALGSNPVRGELQGAPHPWRVEDPLLWLLARNGWIRTERG